MRFICFAYLTVRTWMNTCRIIWVDVFILICMSTCTSAWLTHWHLSRPSSEAAVISLLSYRHVLYVTVSPTHTWTHSHNPISHARTQTSYCNTSKQMPIHILLALYISLICKFLCIKFRLNATFFCFFFCWLCDLLNENSTLICVDTSANNKEAAN